MRKIALLLAIVILVSIPVHAESVTPRVLGVTPELTFNGTTAHCYVGAVGDYTTDTLEMTVRLWKGSYNFKTWTLSGRGYVFLDDYVTVWSGYTYVMTVDLVYNGVKQSRISIANDCP